MIIYKLFKKINKIFITCNTCGYANTKQNIFCANCNRNLINEQNKDNIALKLKCNEKKTCYDVDGYILKGIRLNDNEIIHNHLKNFTVYLSSIDIDHKKYINSVEDERCSLNSIIFTNKRVIFVSRVPFFYGWKSIIYFYYDEIIEYKTEKRLMDSYFFGDIDKIYIRTKNNEFLLRGLKPLVIYKLLDKFVKENEGKVKNKSITL